MDLFPFGPGGLRVSPVVEDGSEAGHCFHLFFLLLLRLLLFTQILEIFLTKVTPNNKEENLTLKLLDTTLTASPLKRKFGETLTKNLDSACDVEKKKRKLVEIRPSPIVGKNDRQDQYLLKGTSPLRKLLLRNKAKENEKKLNVRMFEKPQDIGKKLGNFSRIKKMFENELIEATSPPKDRNSAAMQQFGLMYSQNKTLLEKSTNQDSDNKKDLNFKGESANQKLRDKNNIKSEKFS